MVATEVFRALVLVTLRGFTPVYGIKPNKSIYDRLHDV